MDRLYNILNKIASWAIAPMEVETGQGSVTVGAGTGAAATVNVSKSGYFPLAVCGIQVAGDAAGSAEVRQYRMTAQSSGSGTAYAYIWNNATASKTWTVTFHVLWLKQIGGGYCIAVFSRLATISSLVRRWRHEQTLQHLGLHGRQNQKHDYHFSNFNNHHKNSRSEQECNSTRCDGIRVCMLDSRFNVRLDREPVLRDPRRKDNQCLARYCNGLERSVREHSLSGIISQGITTIPERGCVA